MNLKRMLEALMLTAIFVAFAACVGLTAYMYTEDMPEWSVYFTGCAMLNGYSLYRLSAR